MYLLKLMMIGLFLSTSASAFDENLNGDGATEFREIALYKRGVYLARFLRPVIYTKELTCSSSRNLVSCEYITYLDSPPVTLFKKQYRNESEAMQIATNSQNQINIARAQDEDSIQFGLDSNGNPIFKLLEY